jgi:hypothetical protein
MRGFAAGQVGDLGNGALRLPHAQYGTKPISGNDQSEIAPLSTVYAAGAEENA